jgi:ribosomal protein S18 acetylase RimI-like enzyme
MNLKLITAADDLDAICDQIQPQKWGKDNEMTSYQPASLKKLLQEKGILLLAYDGGKIAGIALCYILYHPAGDDSLYVHELDTHPDYRRQGIGTRLMNKAREIAEEKQLKEIWVGTEITNQAARALYKSLMPYEEEPSIIYSYKTKER